MILDLHLNVGAAPWPQVVEVAQAAESSGASTVWIADHLASYSVGGHVAPECFAALGALAQATTSVGLGSLVANAVLRPAALLANATATVQRVSGGRFVLGVGAGASPASPWARELVAAGIELRPTLAERHAHLATVVDEVRLLKKRDFADFKPIDVRNPRVTLAAARENLVHQIVGAHNGRLTSDSKEKVPTPHASRCL